MPLTRCGTPGGTVSRRPGVNATTLADRELHVAVDPLHRDRPVGVVLVHLTPRLEGDLYDPDTGVLGDGLGGVIRRVVGIAGSNNLQFGRQGPPRSTDP
jgi:hypothetical protein